MSIGTESAVYSPYGAYELKAKYQRNLLLGTFLITVMVLLSVGGAWIFSTPGQTVVIDDPPLLKIRTELDIPPPPVVIRPRIKIEPSGERVRMGHIPIPVSDSLMLDEDVVIASRSELAELLPSGDRTGPGGMIEIEDPFDQSLQSMTQFIPVEVQPEMIYRRQPIYPRLAEKAGITGVVWVSVLVDEEGNVLKAIVGKTSGVVSLDEAAVAAALKCKYKPGIQNGRPIKVLVTYKYEFESPK